MTIARADHAVPATVALTGATGFVGQATLQQLLQAGLTVKALVRPGKSLGDHPGLESLPGSLEDGDSLIRLVEGCQAVVHVAGAIAGRNAADFNRVNVSGTERLLEAISGQTRPARLIHVSSLAAREPALSDYAASKHLAEVRVAASGLEFVIIRPPAVYGPNDPALAPLWRGLARGWLTQLGSDSARFSLIHVDDLATALLEAVRAPALHADIVCPDDLHPGGYGWADIARIAEEAGGRRVRRLRLPGLLVRAAGQSASLISRLRLGAAPVFSAGKARELLHPDWRCRPHIDTESGKNADNTQLTYCPEWRPTMTLRDSLNTLPGWRQA
ncbi:MAG: NAD-dependent epimerase/dehydratase family protein [Wenzhouxiangella sp.]